MAKSIGYFGETMSWFIALFRSRADRYFYHRMDCKIVADEASLVVFKMQQQLLCCPLLFGTQMI